MHHHHTGEDIALWPRVRTHLEGRPNDLALLDVMEAEHVRIGPTIEDIDAAVADNGSGPARLAEATAEFFPYILTGADPERSAQAVGIFPPPLRMLIPTRVAAPVQPTPALVVTGARLGEPLDGR